MSRRASERCANEWLAATVQAAAACGRGTWANVDDLQAARPAGVVRIKRDAPEMGTFLLALCFLLGLWAGWMVGRFLP